MSGPPRPAGPVGTAPAPVEKKGELAELRTLLRTVNMDKDSKRKRDVIKKVIAYHTLGIDVSRLFSDMILACNTRDLVVKKMVYLYLSAYASSHPDVTLLAINTLQKDCRDEDPMIRGLALRALTSLRLPSILEYVLQPLKSALADSSAYVRQAGVLGVLKVWHLSPEAVKEADYVDALYGMMRDRDPQVVINCVSALNEILADEGGIAVNTAIVHYLLGRLRELSDWGQCLVMDVVARYTPANEDELFGIMNLLDGCLKVAHSGVVLGATKCFLAFTAGLPDIARQVALRLKTPLLTLCASSSPEVAYAVLSHVSLMIERQPGVFDDEFKQFFCKYNEPGAVKALKVAALPRIASPTNARDIVAELAEYVGGVDAELAIAAVRAIGDIAVRVPPAAEVVVEALLELVEMDAEYVRSETVVVMQDLLRKYPERAASVLPSLHRCLKRMDAATGKAAVVWMLGEFGQLIDDAPYILEPLIDAIVSAGGRGDAADASVRCELLTSTVKLFFKRPPEVQRMLGRLLKACLGDGVEASVHDRALLYYRLLRADVVGAAAVISGEREPVVAFREEQSPEVDAKIWAEFNTLSVLYGKPSELFIAASHQRAAQALPPPPPRAAADDDSLLGNADGALGADDGIAIAGAPHHVPAAAAPTAAAAAEEDLLGFGGGGASSYAAPTPMAPTFNFAPAAPPLLAPDAALDAASFQQKWGTLPIAAATTFRAGRVPASAAELEAAMRRGSFFPVASGDVGGAIKCYVFARDGSMPTFHLWELVLDKATATVSATLKSENGATAGAVAAALAAVLAAM